MANDRLFIKCRACGEWTMLARYFPSMGHGPRDAEDLSKIGLFVSLHMECSPHFGGMDLEGDRCFDIVAESDEKAPVKLKGF